MLKTEVLLARALGERLDASVVQVAAAIEHAALDSGLLAASASALPTAAACSVFEPDILPSEVQPAEASVGGLVVDELREDAAVRAENDEARPLGRAGDLPADAAMAAHARLALREDAHARLPDLPADLLVAVADSLALVGLGRAHLADLGSGLADHLLVDSLDDDLRRASGRRT